MASDRTLLRTQRPVLPQIQRAWQEQKREMYSSVTSMEQRLQKQIEDTLEKHSVQWKVEMAFAVGVWSAISCCVIILLCLKVYKIRHRKKR